MKALDFGLRFQKGVLITQHKISSTVKNTCTKYIESSKQSY